MRSKRVLPGTEVAPLGDMLIIISIIALVFLAGTWSFQVYGLEVIPKSEAPLGKSYDFWIDKYWNWFISLSTEEAPPRDGGCLIHKVDSMVMLMQPIFGGVRTQNCSISSGDNETGIMIPLWTAWCDSGANLDDISNPSVNLNQKLTKCAREVYNLGNIGSEVKVDNMPVANLNVRMSLNPDTSLDYRINFMNNVTEIYSAGFNLTIPSDSHLPDLVPGEWRAGSHGWWVFLQNLARGEHTIFYNVRVFPTGPTSSPGVNPTSTDITYNLKVN
jgi:hypothetical protein